MLAYGGRIRVEPRPVDLNTVARESLRLLKTSFPESVRLEVDLAKVPVVVEGDPTFVRRILSNLVVNARQAVSEHGFVGVRTESRSRRDLVDDRTWLGEVPRGPMVGVLEVSDDGAGMDDATRERVFEPFYTTKGAGRGMGLATVLGLVRSMGGAVRVESAPGRGTVFQVALPLSSELPDTTRHPERGELDGSVLVVDDDPMVRRVLGAMLERSGFRTVLAASGEAALRELGEQGFRAVILDVEMPGLSGEDLLRQVALAAPDVPVLVTSGYDEGTALSRLGGLSVAGFVQKPFTQAGLEEALRSVLEPRGLG
jgi:CheY-like chemotaxis protein